MLDALLDRGADKARRLAKAGRYREAVAVGRAANRRRPDPSLERDLRDWRYHAFYEQPHTIGRTDWPPRYNDLRPDLVDQIPEINRAELNAEVLGGALHHHGSLLVRNFLSPEKAKAYVDLVDRAFDARANYATNPTQSGYYPLKAVEEFDPDSREEEFVGAMTLLMVDTPQFLARWLDEVESSGVLGVVSEYLGERPSLAFNKATLYRLPPTPGAEWHQDGAFLGGKNTRTVNLWVALTDCGIDAPGLEVVPWRLDDIVQTGTHGSFFNWAVGRELVPLLAEGRPLSAPVFKAGDAMLFDHLCLHRTGVRPDMTRGRYAIETWMFAPSTYGPGVPLMI